MIVFAILFGGEEGGACIPAHCVFILGLSLSILSQFILSSAWFGAVRICALLCCLDGCVCKSGKWVFEKADEIGGKPSLSELPAGSLIGKTFTFEKGEIGEKPSLVED